MSELGVCSVLCVTDSCLCWFSVIVGWLSLSWGAFVNEVFCCVGVTIRDSGFSVLLVDTIILCFSSSFLSLSLICLLSCCRVLIVVFCSCIIAMASFFMLLISSLSWAYIFVV
ncbi:hypothetical protein FKM82_029754 [Ascaphus truei]